MRSVERALDILLSFAEKPVMSATEVQEIVGLARPTLYRLLNTLETKGLLRSSGQPRKYELSYRVGELASAWHASLDLTAVSQPYLHRMWEQTNETISLYQLEGQDQRVCVHEIRSKNPLSFAPGFGARPLYSGAPGKAILAFLPAPAIELALRSLPDDEARTRLTALLERVRKDGVCISMGERIPGGAAIAAPIFDGDQTVVGSIALALPQVRLDEDTRANHQSLVRKTAAEISRELGNKES